MNRKIFDILPPGLPTGVSRVGKTERKPSSFGWRPIALIALAVLGAGGALYQIMGTELVVHLEPATRIANLEVEFRVWAEAEELDLYDNIVPGELIEKTLSEERTFTASGEKVEEGFAEGVIRVYNQINPPREIRLRATTRFLASTGEYFQSPESIYIPPAEIQGGRLTASWTDVPVRAMDPGPASNIGPTKFSVPGLLGTEIYDKIHGESLQAMSGGAIERRPEVTSADLRQAEEVLKFDLVERMIEGLVADNPDRVVLAEAVDTGISSAGSSEEVGSLEPRFEYSLSLEGRALAFSKNDLDVLLERTVREEMGEEYRLVPDAFYPDYRILSFNPNDGLLRVNLKFSADVYEHLAHEEWPEWLSGLNRSQIRERLLEDERLKAFQFRLSPFWLRRAPRADKINVHLDFP